jgi:endonuclease-3
MNEDDNNVSSPHRNFGHKVFNALKQHKEEMSISTSVDAFQEYWKVLESTQNNFPFSVLVAGVLGSQTRDIVSIATTKDLIDFIGGQLSPEHIIALPDEALLNIIKKCNYCNMKTKYLLTISKQLIEKPEKIKTLSGLLSLTGVGPKIAHLVLSVAYKNEEPTKNEAFATLGKNAGIVVDTHVNKTANRIGLVKSSNKSSSEYTRLKLESIFPKEQWNDVTVLLIGLGQSICGSAPRCEKCPLHKNDLCSSSKQFILDKIKKKSLGSFK